MLLDAERRVNGGFTCRQAFQGTTGFWPGSELTVVPRGIAGQPSRTGTLAGRLACSTPEVRGKRINWPKNIWISVVPAGLVQNHADSPTLKRLGYSHVSPPGLLLFGVF